jgi:hypothetical protein
VKLAARVLRDLAVHLLDLRFQILRVDCRHGVSFRSSAWLHRP